MLARWRVPGVLALVWAAMLGSSGPSTRGAPPAMPECPPPPDTISRPNYELRHAVWLSGSNVAAYAEHTDAGPDMAAVLVPYWRAAWPGADDALWQGSVSWRTVDGSALAGQDYEAASGTWSWRYVGSFRIEEPRGLDPGEPEIRVAIIDDETAEPPESFFVELYGESGDAVVDCRQAEVIIWDDDLELTIDVPRIVDIPHVIEGSGRSVREIEAFVRLSQPQPVDGTVTLQVSDAGATSGGDPWSGARDYSFAGGEGFESLELSAGQQSARFVITLYGDDVPEPDEDIELTAYYSDQRWSLNEDGTGNYLVWPLSGWSVSAQATTLLTIGDDDEGASPSATPGWSFSDATFRPGQTPEPSHGRFDGGASSVELYAWDAMDSEAAGALRFGISLSGALDRDLPVDYRVIPGNATPGDDYWPDSGRIVIPAGQLFGEIVISLVDDDDEESDEVFSVEMVAPGVLVLTPSVFGTILDDDRPPELYVEAAVAMEGDGVMRFGVWLSAPARQPVGLSYRTRDGSAIAGEDYVASGAEQPTPCATPPAVEETGLCHLAIPAGEVAWVVEVPLLDDATPEPPESLFLDLVGVSGAVLAADSAEGTIYDDDQ